jgi:hypothetical protein
VSTPVSSNVKTPTTLPRVNLTAYGVLALALTLLSALIAPARSSAAIGDLTYVGCIANLGANGCEQPAHDSLRQAHAVAVSPDQESVYVGSRGAVTWFRRRPSGALVYKDCIAHGRTMGARSPGTRR